MLVFISCASKPIPQIVTAKDDRYWSDLVEQSKKSNKSILSILMKMNPDLYKQIQKDSVDSALLTFWGQSLNFDSGAKKKIVDDQLITDLHEQFGLKTDTMIVHAGITHSYGYLFSTISTPYGFKRKRWIDPTLNYAFSFSGNSLGPETMEGSLLSNLTFFVGSITFKNEHKKKALKNLKNVSSEVLHFSYSKLSVETLEEQIQNVKNPVVLRTTLVRLPFKKENEENDYLLIYSILFPKNKNELLITAFPIKSDAYKKITDAHFLGAKQSITIRYNAYLEGLMDKSLFGVRKLSKDSVKKSKI